MMSRSLCVVLLLLAAAPTSADEGVRHLSQHAHSSWRIQDGSLSGAPTAITQTADGYLWVGTSTGLFRFDGVRFVPLAAADTTPAFVPTGIFSLLGGRDGSLWIGTGSNLARVKEGQLTNYTNALGRFNTIVEDDRGAVWVTRTRASDNAGPLCQPIDAQMRCQGSADGISVRVAGALVAHPDGSFWFASAATIVRWSAGASTVYRPSQLQSAASLSGVASLAIAPDGAVWVGITRSGPGQGLQQIQEGVFKPVAVPGFDGSQVAVNVLFVDREKAMWIGTEGQGIYRVADGRVDRFLRADGLSGDSVTAFYEDREGNVWVATSEGVDCFRKTAMVSF